METPRSILSKIQTPGMTPMTIFTRACSFPRSMEFRAEPWNLDFLPRNQAAEFVFLPCFDVFHTNKFFHRKWPQSSSITSLLTLIFGLMVMVDWW